MANHTVALVTVVLLSSLAVALGGDACTLPTRSVRAAKFYDWAGPPSQLRACYALIPFYETTRTNTLAVLRQVIGLYSFTDIAKNSGVPYNVQVPSSPLPPLL